KGFLPFYVAHTVLGLHHQLLRGEVVDIQGDLPVVWGLLLGHDGRVGHHGGVGEVLRQGGHAERLVEDAAPLVPLTERVPARGAEQGERDASLCHGCRGEGRGGGVLLFWRVSGRKRKSPFGLFSKGFPLPTCCLLLS
uniref:Uncharacterized protein n=1 Tax=Myripristis murdjan TaxID=586833 RepID=A0A667ZCA3_9TELE